MKRKFYAFRKIFEVILLAIHGISFAPCKLPQFGKVFTKLSIPITELMIIAKHEVLYEDFAGSRIWGQKWTKISNRHFSAVAVKMKESVGDGRIAEVFSETRHLCETYGNSHISPTNDVFNVKRGSIVNSESRAVSPDFVQTALHRLENGSAYEHAPRFSAQARLQQELGLRREKTVKAMIERSLFYIPA